jgi:hypothetical protein
MNRLRLRTGLAAVSSLALVVAACGDDSDDDTTDRTAPAESDATDTADADEPTEADDGEAVIVRGVDYAFEDLPDTVSVGTQLTLVNESDEELHELVAFRIPDDEERSAEELFEAPPEGEDEAPPDMVLIAPPGEEGEAVLGDGTLTEPGRYALGCFIPTGADPAEYMAAAEEATNGPPEVAGGPPHFVHGMFAELTVE